jgi:hypothetical protein
VLKLPRRGRTPTSVAFDGLCLTVWHVGDARLRKRLWSALERDRSPRAQTWRFELGRLVRRYRDKDYVNDLILRVFGPQEVIPWLEGCAETGKLTRLESNRAMEGILGRTAADGGWQ